MYDLAEGEIRYNGKLIHGPRFNLIPGEDFIKHLAQDFDLMPYITVAENVGKFLSNTNKTKKQERINELLEMVEMHRYANVKAQFLSGGQMQRVAIARVLALEPEVLLLDEPFSHIDSFRRNSISRKLFAYLKEKEITTIVATHDSSDVLSFADEVLILKDGKVVELGNPKSLFSHPENKYAASLFGDVNEISAHYLKTGTSITEKMLVYPHQLKTTIHSALMVTVKTAYYRGSYYLIEAIYEDGMLFFESEREVKKGIVVYLILKD